MSDLSRSQKVAWLNEYDRRQSLKSLFYFGKQVIGYDLVPDTHLETCEMLDEQTNRSLLLLLPRGSFKTSIASQLYVVRRLIENPNLRFLLDSEVLQNSQNNLGVIKRIFESHPRVRSIWGDFTSKVWTQDYITVGKRTNFTLKEPSVTATSIDTVNIGTHYDEIICDDLHSEKNTKSREQVEWVIKHFRLLFSLLDPGGRITVIGTRWSDFDLYGKIIEELKDFKVISHGAYNDDGSLFFPERLTKDFLANQRRILGGDLFNSQYMNNPVPSDENARFKRDWFRYFDRPPEDLDIYIAVDPALPGSAAHDYFAIVVVGLDKQNNLYVLNTLYGNWEPHEAIDKIFMVAGHYNRRLRGIGIETNIFQKLIKFQFQAEMKKRGRFYRVVEVKHYSESKEERILSLQPRYECGAIYHHKALKDGELEEELIKFPRGKKRDVADALASILEIANLRTVSKKRKRDAIITDRNGMFNAALEQLRGRKKRMIHPSLGSNF